MKVAYLANCQSSHTKRWINYFKTRGHDVFAITSEADDALDVKQYPLKRGIPIPIAKAESSFKYAISPCAISYVKAVLAKERPDILHAHYASNYGYIGARTGFHPFVLTAWGSDILINPSQYGGILGRMVKHALITADTITCDADHMVGAMTKLGADESKIHVVYFGTDPKKFSPEQRSGDIRVKMSGVGRGDSQIIFSIRNLEPIYDIETFVRAVPLVLAKVPDARFVVAGKGSQAEFLKGLAESLNVSRSVVFTGSIPFEEVPKYVASADIYVSTSLSDAGLSASTAEAMASGLPVVITDFGDNKKWVSDGANGYLIPLKSPDSLAEKLIYLLKNKHVREKFGAANRSIIEDRLNYWKAMDGMEKLYVDLTERQTR
jgi:glycosyltransferase involved in cell wall biosynthesis